MFQDVIICKLLEVIVILQRDTRIAVSSAKVAAIVEHVVGRSTVNSRCNVGPKFVYSSSCLM